MKWYLEYDGWQWKSHDAQHTPLRVTTRRIHHDFCLVECGNLEIGPMCLAGLVKWDFHRQRLIGTLPVAVWLAYSEEGRLCFGGRGGCVNASHSPWKLPEQRN